MAKKTAPEGEEAKPAEAAAPAAAEAPKGKKKPAKADAAPAAPTAEAPASPEAAAPAAAAAPGERTAGKKKKPGIPPARGKKLRNLLKQQRSKLSKEPSPLKKAMTTLKGLKRAKFDETVEVHMSLGVDTTQSDQLVRGTVPLPHGVGKTVRVVVFCQGDNVGKAKEAGADFAGSDELIEKITKQNWLEFDVALATQDMMGKVSRIAKVLGPRGLMPTPKSGTVVTGDVAQAVKDFKAGKVEYRTDKGGNVHAGVGKISFDENKLVENAHAFIEAVRAAKPAGVKGHFIQSITICSTMSPGVPISIT
jgi:large subunit ribosomal protein L1